MTLSPERSAELRKARMLYCFWRVVIVFSFLMMFALLFAGAFALPEPAPSWAELVFAALWLLIIMIMVSWIQAMKWSDASDNITRQAELEEFERRTGMRWVCVGHGNGLACLRISFRKP